MKIFLSYSRDDAGNFAKHVQRYLVNAGHDVFIDVNSIKIGEPWADSIEKNISECDIFVVILTPDSLGSNHVENEVLEAQRENKIIVPCIHEYVNYNELKWGLDKIQGIEFSNEYQLVLNLYPKMKNYEKDKKPIDDVSESNSTGTLDGRIRLLFLAASPEGTVPLELDREFDIIDKTLRDHNVREKFELIKESHASFSKLVSHIYRHAPNIIHFTGNATSECLIFENEQGEIDQVNSDRLRETFRIISKKIPVRCVLLNACDSVNVAQAISEYVDCAIGISGMISDRAAIIFSSYFYEALANRLSVIKAVEYSEIKLKDLVDNNIEYPNEAAMPKIYSRAGVDLSKIIILEESQILNDQFSAVEVKPSHKPYQKKEEKINYDPKKIFIGYGEDESSKCALAEIITELRLEPVMLESEANSGRKFVEKFEEYNVGFAFVLLTPDEEGRKRSEIIESTKSLRKSRQPLRLRAGQNVLFELGYLMGKLGRNRICCLYKGNIDTPSNLGGIGRLEYEKSIDECYRNIIRELTKAGYLDIIR